jgi:hypothetical protein
MAPEPKSGNNAYERLKNSGRGGNRKAILKAYKAVFGADDESDDN